MVTRLVLGMVNSMSEWIRTDGRLSAEELRETILQIKLFSRDSSPHDLSAENAPPATGASRNANDRNVLSRTPVGNSYQRKALSPLRG